MNISSFLLCFRNVSTTESFGLPRVFVAFCNNQNLPGMSSSSNPLSFRYISKNKIKKSVNYFSRLDIFVLLTGKTYFRRIDINFILNTQINVFVTNHSFFFLQLMLRRWVNIFFFACNCGNKKLLTDNFISYSSYDEKF